MFTHEEAICMRWFNSSDGDFCIRFNTIVFQPFEWRYDLRIYADYFVGASAFARR
jgi:hypothetical protein